MGLTSAQVNKPWEEMSIADLQKIVLTDSSSRKDYLFSGSTQSISPYVEGKTTTGEKFSMGDDKFRTSTFVFGRKGASFLSSVAEDGTETTFVYDQTRYRYRRIEKSDCSGSIIEIPEKLPGLSPEESFLNPILDPCKRSLDFFWIPFQFREELTAIEKSCKKIIKESSRGIEFSFLNKQSKEIGRIVLSTNRSGNQLKQFFFVVQGTKLGMDYQYDSADFPKSVDFKQTLKADGSGQELLVSQISYKIADIKPSSDRDFNLDFPSGCVVGTIKDANKIEQRKPQTREELNRLEENNPVNYGLVFALIALVASLVFMFVRYMRRA